MVAGNLQVDLGEGLAAEHEGKAAVQTTQVAEIGGVVVVGVLPAKGEEGSPLPCRFLHGTAGFFIAAVIQDGMGLLGEPGVALHGVFHGVEVFHVVIIDIEDEGDIRVGGKEGILEFAGLVHKALRCPAAAVAADGTQLAANDGGGVQPRHIQDLHDHGGGGGFTVGTADAQRLAVPAGDGPQHFGALPQGQAAFPRGNQFGVGIHNGGGIENEIGALDVFCPLTHHHLNAHLAFEVDDVAFVIIAAGNGVAPAVQDLHQREHAAAADANAMNMFDPFRDCFNRFYHTVTATFKNFIHGILYPISRAFDNSDGHFNTKSGGKCIICQAADKANGKRSPQAQAAGGRIG